MGVIPRLKSFRREDYPGESEGFYRLLSQLTPFVGDVTSALSGGLDASNLGRQYESLTFTTSSSLQTTFAPGKVVIKNKLGFKPRSVTLAKCQPSVAPDYTQETWTTATLTNSWVAFGAGFQAPEYRLVNGKVELRGLMKNGTIGAVTAFSLPWGPPDSIVFDTDSNNAHGGGRIFPSGIVQAVIGNNAWFSLENVSFEPTAGTWKGIGPFGAPQWSLTSNGTVQINYISGLSPLTSYDLTFVLE